jgi:TP901 family phage tail tape measure protein
VEVAELAILLTARIGDLEKKIDRANVRVTGMQNHFKKASTAMRAGFLKMVGVLATLGVSIFGAIALVRSMVRTNVEFNKSMQDVLAKTQATSEELKAMTDIAREMGSTTIFSASQSAEAMAGLATMGLKTADTMRNVLKPSLDLAAATNMSIADSSLLVVKTIKAFRLEMSDAAKVANVLAAAHVNSTATVDVLREAFKFAGPVAGDLGQSLEDVTAIAANFTNIGLEASQAGTAYRMVMARLTKAFKENGEASGETGRILEEHGFTHKKMAELLPKPIELMKELRKAQLGNSEAIQVYGTRAKFAFSGLVELAGGIELLRDKITGTNTAAEIAAIQLDSIWGKSKIVKSVFEELSITLGDRIIPFVKDFLDILAKMITEFTENSDNIDNLINGFSGFASLVIKTAQTIANVSANLKFLSVVLGVISKQAGESAPKSFSIFKSSIITDAINPVMTFTKLITQSTIPAIKLLKSGMGEKWDESPIAKIEAAYNELQDTMSINALTADTLIHSLSKVGEVGGIQKEIESQAKLKELLKGNSDTAAAAVAAKTQAEIDLNIKILQLEGKKTEAFKANLDKEVAALRKAKVTELDIQRFTVAKTNDFRKQLVKDQVSSLKQMETFENASAADRVSMLTSLADQYRDNAVVRLEIEQELTKAVTEMNKEALETINEYLTGPLTEGFTTMFQGIIEGTGTAAKTLESFGKAMAKAVLNSLAKIAEGYALAAIGKAASGGIIGMIIDQPAIIAAAVASAALRGLAASFAQGGIVGSPGLAMVGDTANKSPEVIAPLDKLQEMLFQPRVTESGVTSTVDATSPLAADAPNVTVVFKPTFSSATPSEARRFGEIVTRVLQDQGWKK